MIKMKPLFLLCCSLIVTSTLATANAGIVISSKQGGNSETTIYQNGIAVFIKNGKANTIVDTNSNNCIVINHKIKKYLYIKCSKFNKLLTVKFVNKQKQSIKKIPYAQQKKMPDNKKPKTAISIKRSGRGSYQGYHIEKFKFIVDNDVVSEYWVSAILREKINKEVNIGEISKIFKIADKYKLFKNGLNSKIENKYTKFKKKQFALKEFRYGGSGTQKIYRHVTIKQINIREYMPPRSYKISSSFSQFIRIER